MSAMRAEAFRERRVDVGGWPVNIASYQLGEVFHCRADNVSPGATLARTTGSTRQEAESKALERAQVLLARTRRQAV